MNENTNDPRTGQGARARSRVADAEDRTTTPRPALLSRVTIDDLAAVLGQSYIDGPFACIYCHRRTSLLTAYIVDDTLARCGRCGREITLGRLRRHVTEDPVLARSLRRLLAVAV